MISTKGTHRLREQTYGCQGEGQGQAIAGEFEISMYTLLYFKWIANKDLLYSTWNFAQHYVAILCGWRGVWGRMCWGTQSCPTLCDSTGCSPPGSSVHRIFPARILEWAVISSSRVIFPTQGLNPYLASLTLQADSLLLSHWRMDTCVFMAESLYFT